MQCRAWCGPQATKMLNEEIGALVGGLRSSSNSSVAAFSRMEARVEALEAEAEAAGQLGVRALAARMPQRNTAVQCFAWQARTTSCMQAEMRPEACGVQNSKCLPTVACTAHWGRNQCSGVLMCSSLVMPWSSALRCWRAAVPLAWMRTC